MVRQSWLPRQVRRSSRGLERTHQSISEKPQTYSIRGTFHCRISGSCWLRTAFLNEETGAPRLLLPAPLLQMAIQRAEDSGALPGRLLFILNVYRLHASLAKVRRLVHLQELITGHVVEHLQYSAWPTNPDCLGDSVDPQSEMYALVAGRKIAAGRRDRRKLPSSGTHKLNFGADCVPVALMSYEFEGDPMVIRRRIVVQNMNRTVIGRDHGI